MLTHNALKNLMQLFELVVTFYLNHKTSHNMHPFCGWVRNIAGLVKNLQLIGGIHCFSRTFKVSAIQSRIRFHFKNKISFVENGLISKETVDTTVSYTNITMKKRCK